MNDRSPGVSAARRPSLWARRAALGGALLALALLAVTVSLRAGHPFELEWMEGGIVEHAGRVRAGAPLYVEPSLDFTPFIYTPLGHVAAAGAIALFGETLVAARSVSIVSTLALIALIVLFVRRETGRLDAGLVAAGLFAATWELTGAWLDLARVDALFLALLVGAIAVLRAARTSTGDAAAALLALLAFLAKQTALPVAALFAAWCLLARHGARRMVYPAVLLAGVAVIVGAGNATTGGWFSYYVFELPSAHRIVTERLASFWLADVRAFLPAVAAALAVPLLQLARGRGRDASFFATLLLGAIAVSWAGRVHVGGWLNAALPLTAAVALTVGAGLPLFAFPASRRGVAAPREAGHDSSRPPDGSDSRETDRAASPLARPLVAAAIVAQLLLLADDPRDRLPTAADRAAGEALVARIAAVDGDVFVPFHGYLATRAGKRGHAHAMALEDVFRGGDEARRTALRREISEALHDGRFAAVVLDRDRWGLVRELRHRYDAAPPPFESESVFRTVTGLPTRPEAFFVLRDEARAAR